MGKQRSIIAYGITGCLAGLTIIVALLAMFALVFPDKAHGQGQTQEPVIVIEDTYEDEVSNEMLVALYKCAVKKIEQDGYTRENDEYFTTRVISLFSAVRWGKQELECPQYDYLVELRRQTNELIRQ